ncbi:MAG: phenylacetate--CoA ligase family protein [Trueperaceae bacterium]|nr:phenylacetate--CoA ligase family protein [Trueperaceae bacterium]
MKTLMAIYRRSPPFAQAIAGSLYGYKLRWWRYGGDTDALAAAAVARERWSEAQWHEWQSSRLAAQLERAATRVPYYREQWRRRREAGDDAAVTDLANWPVLRKEALRSDPSSFLADDVDPKSLFRLTTSGTSGTPIVTWRSRDTMRAWYALMEARWRGWYGVTRHDRWALVGGRLVVDVERTRPPFWIWNAGLNQLYLSNLHITRENLPAYLDALRRYRIVHLYGYSSSLAELARHALDLGLEAPRMKVVVTNAEPLTPGQRAVIERAFGCPARESYGMSEAVTGASQCEHGALHLWPEAGVLEVVGDDDAPLAAGDVGRLIATGLLNAAMPLIRYEVGDRGALAAEEAPCACGRSLPRLARVEGRTNDSLVASDGRKVFYFQPVFFDLPIHEGQIVQETLGNVVVKVVPTSGFGERAEAALKSRVRERLGQVDVEVRLVERIERGPNGKFKAVMSLVRDQM